MATGKIKTFDPLRGFGFIIPDHWGEDVYLHIKQVADKMTQPVQAGQRVSYTMITGRHGRPAAEDVKRL